MKMPTSRYGPALWHALVVAVVLVGMLVVALLLLDASTAHPAQPALDNLRLRAASRDWDANRRLTRMLLDRYEQSNDSEDLFEAMLWLEMDWDSPTLEHTLLQLRIFNRYCTHRVLRWHWLCNPGE